MKKAFLQALLISGLLSGAYPASASEQTTVSHRDRDWMKQQQQALEEFKGSLQDGQLQLPAAQQDLVSRLQQGMQPAQNDDGRTPFPAIYFVSLGIAKEGLLPMLRDAHRFGIPATIRGLLGNDMRKTAAAMFELSKESKNAGVQIDPTLFSEYGITAVPALVVTCPGHFDVIRGSLPLQQALEKVSQEGECAAVARQLMEKAK